MRWRFRTRIACDVRPASGPFAVWTALGRKLDALRLYPLASDAYVEALWCAEDQPASLWLALARAYYRCGLLTSKFKF